MAELLDDDHHCAWRVEAESLRAQVEALKGKLAAVTAAMEALERRVLGPNSEKLPSPEQELKKDAQGTDGHPSSVRRAACTGSAAAGNSLACRLYHATVAAIAVTPNGKTHCSHTAANPTAPCTGSATP